MSHPPICKWRSARTRTSSNAPPAQRKPSGACSRQIFVAQPADIPMARLAAAQLADQIGLDTIQKHCVVTSVSELASNILVHACSGSIALSTTTRSDGTVGLEVLAADRGRGIRDIGQALQDGFSTRGGLGGGLPAVRRLMSELAITSAPARGTTIRATKWLREPSPYALSCLEPEPSATNRPATRGPPARADGPTTCAERPYTPRMSSDPPLPR